MEKGKEMKDSFVLYVDQAGIIEDLDDAEAGEVLRGILTYANGEEPEFKSRAAKIAFKAFRATLDRDSRKWEETSQKRSEAGKRGLQSRWHKDEPLEEDSKEDFATEEIANDSKKDFAINEIAAVADSVSVSVSDNKKRDIREKSAVPAQTSRKTFKKPSLGEVQQYILINGYHVNAERWYAFYESKNWMIGKNKMADWKAAVRTWEQSEKDRARPDPKRFANFEQRDTDYDRLVTMMGRA